MSSDGEQLSFDHHLPHADGSAIAEDVQVKAHPERQTFTYQHIYPNDPSLQRVIEVAATGGKEDTWQEIERTGKVLYKNNQGHVFAQLEHGTVYENLWLTVGTPKGEKLYDHDALVQINYLPDSPPQMLLQANTPDFEEIATYPNWEEYLPLLRYFLQDEKFIKASVDVTDEPYKAEYKQLVQDSNLHPDRFLDGILLTEVRQNARELMDRAIDEAFPQDAHLQLQAWEVLEQFGMLSDFSGDVLQEVLRRYEDEKMFMSMHTVLNRIKESEIMQNVLDKTTKRIAQFRRMASVYTVACTLSDDTFHASIEQRKFGRDDMQFLRGVHGPYGATFPLPEGNEITIDKEGGLVHIVYDITKYEDRRFRNWEITVPYALPIAELAPMMLSRTMPFQEVRNIAPVVFLRPHDV